MTRRRLLLIALALIAALLALGGWRALQSRRAAAPATTAIAAPVLELTDDELTRVRTGALSRRIPVTGTLKASHQTVLRARVAGELVSVDVREGMRVTQGQLIARIDAVDFEARVREREALLRSADAQLDQANRNRDSQRRLLEREFISRNAFDATQSAADVAQANRDAAHAQLAQARKALADTVVRAPMDGFIAERFAQAGEKVSPDAKLVSIVDLSQMEIEASVPASEITRIAVGQPIRLQVEGIAGAVSGQVLRISPTTSAGTRSIPVHIGVDSQGARLRAGLFAQGDLAVERRDAQLLVPAAAVREIGGRRIVYRIADDRITAVVVRTGERDDAGPADNGTVGIVEILDGLHADDRIVGVNLGTLRDGTPVRILSAPSAGRP